MSLTVRWRCCECGREHPFIMGGGSNLTSGKAPSGLKTTVQADGTVVTGGKLCDICAYRCPTVLKEPTVTAKKEGA